MTLDVMEHASLRRGISSKPWNSPPPDAKMFCGSQFEHASSDRHSDAGLRHMTEYFGPVQPPSYSQSEPCSLSKPSLGSYMSMLDESIKLVSEELQPVDNQPSSWHLKKTVYSAPTILPSQVSELNNFIKVIRGNETLDPPKDARISYIHGESRDTRHGIKIAGNPFTGIPKERPVNHLGRMSDTGGLFNALPRHAVGQKRKVELPMDIHGSTFAACPDSGSEENIMVTDLVAQLGLSVEDALEHQKEFRIANGKVVKALGRTSVQCSFTKEPEAQFQCWFYVFQSLITPLIMGMAFLDATETFTKYKHRLQSRLVPRAGPLQLYALNNPARRIRCLADMKPILANADTGAEMDLMSLAYAKRRGYANLSKIGLRDNQVQFADGSKAYLVGKVNVSIILGDNSGPVVRRHNSGLQLKRTFYILDGLTSDMLFGEEFLDETNAFETYKTAFAADQSGEIISEVNTIVWCNTPERFLARFGRGNTAAPEPLSVETADPQPKPQSESTVALIKRRVDQFLNRKSSSSPQDVETGTATTADEPLPSFSSRLDERDARELHRRELASEAIARLPDEQKAAAALKEMETKKLYDEDKERLLQARGVGHALAAGGSVGGREPTTPPYPQRLPFLS